MTNLPYIDIDNTAPVIRLWQQYKNNDVIVSFFNYLQIYWQAQYFDYINNFLIPNLSIYNANCSYLYFFVQNIFDISVPIKINEGSKYDLSLPYDSGLEYDSSTGSVPITFAQFKTVLAFILDWSMPNWDMPTLFYLISKFLGITYDQIIIAQDSTNLDLITISVPNSYSSLLLQLMINYYSKMLGLPFGVTFTITLT